MPETKLLCKVLMMENDISMTPSQCYCCSGVAYSKCCQPLHDGKQKALTAEQLMRSRYSAFAISNVDYIKHTWDKNTCPENIEIDNETTQWERLEIIQTKKGNVGDNKGVVHFKAFHSVDGKQQVLSEISRFVKKSSRWYYLDGTVKSIQTQNQTPSEGKNAPCSCGSGKKYKRCCGKQ